MTTDATPLEELEQYRQRVILGGTPAREPKPRNPEDDVIDAIDELVNEQLAHPEHFRTASDRRRCELFGSSSGRSSSSLPDQGLVCRWADLQ